MSVPQVKLQHLPKHLVQNIAFKAAQWQKPMLGLLPSTGNPAWKMVPYLGLCQSWRSHCTPLYCHEVAVCLSQSLNEIEVVHYWLAMPKDIAKLMGQQFTRYAHLHVPLGKVLDGTLPRLLAQPPYSTMVFPSVSTVWFKMYQGSNVETEAGHKHIDMFVGQIKKMFPGAHTFSVSSLVVSPEWHMCDEIIGKVMGCASRGLLFHAEHFAATPPHITGLARIVYSEGNADGFLRLIRTNAATLQTLTMELLGPESFTQLVACMAENDECFPALQTLDVSCLEPSEPSEPGPRTHAQGSVFPALRRLEFRHPYAFTGDVLFRGNTVLEHLEMCLDADDARVLAQMGVFRRNRFPRLEFASFDIRGQYPVSTFCELGLRIQHLQIKMSLPSKETLIHSLGTHALSQLKYLSIGAADLTIHEAIALLTRLPGLAQLEVSPKTVDFNTHRCIQDHTSQEYLSYLMKTHYPLAPMLRHVIFDLAIFSDMEGAAHFAAQLAILCPKLGCLRWHTYSAVFEDNCRMLVGSPVYSKYAERLELVDWSKGC
ncbi:hypothetical protein BX070DRAFT_41752 [Coemansia spiralis]|nr:hypothetical protein BX070DRAFT_41752 [Coemansia spiralis]